MAQHKILFVCLGNICRSPMAEGVFRHAVSIAGREADFHIDSAGTGSWHIGKSPHSGSQRAASARGIDISAQRCRQVTRDDFDAFDLLIGMDRSNVVNLAAMAPAGLDHKARLFMDFAQGQAARDIPDPWGEDAAAYDRALDLIEAASAGLLASLPRP